MVRMKHTFHLVHLLIAPNALEIDRLHRRYSGILWFRGAARCTLEIGTRDSEAASLVCEVLEVSVLAAVDFFSGACRGQQWHICRSCENPESGCTTVA